MTPDLTGRTVVVTGAAAGQGRAAARIFGEHGANVVLADVDEAGLADSVSVVGGDRALAVPTDLGVVSSIDSLVEVAADRFGAIDVIYNNAGVIQLAPVGSVSEPDWDRVHAINVKGPFFLVQRARPFLVRSDSASVINVASTAGLIVSSRGAAAYASSKGALIALTRALARDLADDGVRVNCIVPGPIDTDMPERFYASMDADERERARQATTARTMLGRFGDPTEVASAALFLASDLASFITGAVLAVDGGVLAG